MSTTEPHPEPSVSASPDTRPPIRVSPGAVVFVALSVALIAAATYLYRRQHPWVEIVGKDLLQTTASSRTIASARDAVIRKHQNWIVGDDGKRHDPSYEGSGRTWSAGPSEDLLVKVTRGKTQITDKNDATLSIESISATNRPTLIFIHYDNPRKEQRIVNDLVSELVENGATVR